jgi:hypothetical protein
LDSADFSIQIESDDDYISIYLSHYHDKEIHDMDVNLHLLLSNLKTAVANVPIKDKPRNLEESFQNIEDYIKLSCEILKDNSCVNYVIQKFKDVGLDIRKAFIIFYDHGSINIRCK